MISRLPDIIRQFISSKRANAAILFGMTAFPMAALVGTAVDFGQAHSVKTSFQSALDSAALMLSREAVSLTAAQLQANANKYVLAQFVQPQASNVAVQVSYSGGSGSQIVLSGSADVATSFMNLMGYSSLRITATTTTKWGNSRLRVALVLDNTGSMANYNKIGALKTATNTMLDQLQSAGRNSEDVYVSIVPFSKDVNLDPANANATWIDWTEWDAANGTCTKTRYRSRSSCQSQGGVWTPADHATWNGCVMDRGGTTAPDTANYDTNVLPPDPSQRPSLFAAEQYSYCAQPTMGLSNNWTMMNSVVNGMSPAGNTNQGIGLALGWMTLAGGGVFNVPPMDPSYTYIQAIVLLSDGLNTQNRWYTSQTSINARQQKTCDNIKAAGIKIYTVQVNTDGDPTSTLLQNCASSPDNFFLLTSSDQMLSVFQTIGNNLTRLYIAQ